MTSLPHTSVVTTMTGHIHGFPHPCSLLSLAVTPSTMAPLIQPTVALHSPSCVSSDSRATPRLHQIPLIHFTGPAWFHECPRSMLPPILTQPSLFAFSHESLSIAIRLFTSCVAHILPCHPELFFEILAGRPRISSTPFQNQIIHFRKSRVLWTHLVH